MATTRNLGEISGPLLIFGGPYGNLQATQTLLAAAKRLNIPPQRIICTGDVVAYCGDGAATVAAIRQAGIQVVMGNCEQSLAQDNADCGCGFEQGSACDVLSRHWFTQARKVIGEDDKAWMASLPETLMFTLNGRKLAVIHGTCGDIGRFIFRSTPVAEKNRDLDALQADGIIAGHCGLPFSQIIGDRLWHNAGVIGMPANDGASRTWYSVIRATAKGIHIELQGLDYDHKKAAARMREQDLPLAYARTLEDGLWPNLDVLPNRERQQRGQKISAQSVFWE